VIRGGNNGIFNNGTTYLFNGGKIKGGNDGLFLVGDGYVYNVGRIRGGNNGIYITGDAYVANDGVIKGNNAGIYVEGNGYVDNGGKVKGGNTGILVSGGGSIDVSGTVTSDHTGIYLGGDGDINVSGTVIAGDVGIKGGSGDQHVDVTGTIDPPLAADLGDGNDSFYARSGSNVQGEIHLGGGDDLMIVGDHSHVPEEMLGGETDEVDGDTLIIGDGLICAEDGTAIANAQAINSLDPNGGSVTYLGETYTWAEFEHIMGGAHVHPCEPGRINDGRINAYDLAAPDALYCTVDQGVSVWQINLEGQGTFAFAVTLDQIKAAIAQATTTGQNQLIQSDANGGALYALSDGTHLQFNAPDLREPGKTYVFLFEDGRCGGF